MKRLVLSLIAVGLLSACAGREQQELEQWMANLRNEIRPNVQKLPEPKKFTPESYKQGGGIDPFNQQKLAAALRKEQSESSKILQAELNRRKEPLEAYPLDAISMVGSLNRGGVLVALLKADNLLYQARVGNYVGQSYGKITKIDETEVVLREIAQDAAGEWVERNTTLQLQESKK